jgi:hypothetical protein
MISIVIAGCLLLLVIVADKLPKNPESVRGRTPIISPHWHKGYQGLPCNVTERIVTCDLVGDHELLLVHNKVDWSQAGCICQQLGLDLAHLPEFTLLRAGDLLWTCLGQFQQAWIGSTYKNYREGCLALETGASVPSGEPEPYNLPCEASMPVLCRKQRD